MQKDNCYKFGDLLSVYVCAIITPERMDRFRCGFLFQSCNVTIGFQL